MATTYPDRVALTVIGEESIDSISDTTYRELDRASARLHDLFVRNGCVFGDTVALCLQSGPLLVASIWAAQRSGLYFTVVNPSLSTSDLDHVVQTSAAKVLIVDSSAGQWAATVPAATWAPPVLLVDDAGLQGFSVIDDLLAECSDAPPDPEIEGAEIVFSSGTTGRPKGVRGALTRTPAGEGQSVLIDIMRAKYGFGADNVYLATAPLHHSGSLRYLMMGGRVGLTAVLMRRFDAEKVLQVIEKYGVTHTQLVPTMMVRIMKLPVEIRQRYDMSSLRFVFHSGAPCPPETKTAMLDWLGPIVYEGYAASEGPLVVTCSPDEARARPGTVGRPLFGAIHICDADGVEVPAGTVGKVWFSGGAPFSYVDDPVGTARSRDTSGRSTVGDLGFVDEGGYLYLRGREDGMAIIHGVNVYPVDTENALLRHPSVVDAAVVAESDPDSGQRLCAFVQLQPDAALDQVALLVDLEQHCRRMLGALQRPSDIRIVHALPRDDAGKLRARDLSGAVSSLT